MRMYQKIYTQHKNATTNCLADNEAFVIAEVPKLAAAVLEMVFPS